MEKSQTMRMPKNNSGKTSNFFSLLIAFVALAISIRALMISERQTEVLDPSSSIYVAKAYLDVTNRVNSNIFQKTPEKYDYPIILQVYNIGTQPIIITRCCLEDNPLVGEAFINENCPRKLYWLNDRNAYIVNKTDPLVLNPSNRILLRTENAIITDVFSNFITACKKDSLAYELYAPSNKDTFYVFSCAYSENLHYVPLLNQYLTKILGNISVNVRLETLNNKKLAIINLPINHGTTNSEKEKNILSINFEQLLLDEFLVSELRNIKKKFPYGYDEVTNTFSTENYNLYVEPILLKMGYGSNHLGRYAPSVTPLIYWNPRKIGKK